MLITLRFKRKVNHHDGVLLYDSDQQNDSDQADHAEIVSGDDQRQQCADSGRGQCGKNRNGVNVAFVQNSEHDIDGDNRGHDQQRFAGKRILKCRQLFPENWCECSPAFNVRLLGRQ